MNTVNTTYIVCIFSSWCYTGNMFRPIVAIFEPSVVMKSEIAI